MNNLGSSLQMINISEDLEKHNNEDLLPLKDFILTLLEHFKIRNIQAALVG